MNRGQWHRMERGMDVCMDGRTGMMVWLFLSCHTHGIHCIAGRYIAFVVLDYFSPYI